MVVLRGIRRTEIIGVTMNEPFVCAPVLLIGFNRPNFMRGQIDAIRVAHPTRLYVAVDGPREGRAGEAEKCAEVRECVKLVDWPCEVKTLFREKNLGCKLGVSGAITWFFENEESGIILEDDCRPSPDFFRFSTEMLEMYLSDERIGAVCGFNHFDLQTDKTVSYHFSSHMDIWGWATWRRAWAKYDVEWQDLRGKTDAIIDGSRLNGFSQKFLKTHVRCLEKGMNTWDIQWFLYSLANHWLNVVPRVRLVSQTGIDALEATHTGGYNCFASKWSTCTGMFPFPLVHPVAIECDFIADKRREKLDAALFYRGITWLGSKLPVTIPFLNRIVAQLDKRR